jgi:hypothetical protein
MLYYAIISFCLSSCANASEMERFIYKEPVVYEVCLEMVKEMVVDVRQHNPRTRARPISMLCVVKDSLKNASEYTVYSFGLPV